MKEFFRGLGKKVQSLLYRIFGKKKKSNLKSVTLGPGKIYINGEPFEQVESITMLSKDEIPNDNWEFLGSIYGDGDCRSGAIEIPSVPESSLNFFNIPLTFLPKPYWCKTLILTLVANQPYEYKAVDLSQYDERKLAHYIIGSTKSPEELTQDYRDETGDDDVEIELLWTDNMCSAIVGEATLYHYEDLDYWEVDYD